MLRLREKKRPSRCSREIKSAAVSELTLAEMFGDTCCVSAPRDFQPDRASRCSARWLISCAKKHTKKVGDETLVSDQPFWAQSVFSK